MILGADKKKLQALGMRMMRPQDKELSPSINFIIFIHATNELFWIIYIILLGFFLLSVSYNGRVE